MGFSFPPTIPSQYWPKFLHQHAGHDFFHSLFVIFSKSNKISSPGHKMFQDVFPPTLSRPYWPNSSNNILGVMTKISFFSIFIVLSKLNKTSRLASPRHNKFRDFFPPTLPRPRWPIFFKQHIGSTDTDFFWVWIDAEQKSLFTNFRP